MAEEEHAPRRRRAVALGYKMGQQGAPVLLAAGQGAVAENIIARAREAGVPVREDPGLADCLVRLQVGKEIPPELYQAVAQVLAFLFRLERNI